MATVNYLLAMEKSLRERLSQLNELKEKVARRSFFDGNQRDEPTYDVRSVDKKITDINKALFEINHKIKESNAKTVIDLNIDYDKLMSEIE